MTNLLILFWFHLVGDFVLQDDFQAVNKGRYDFILFVHAVIWTGTIVAGLMLTSNYASWKVVLLLIGHYFIDRWKARKNDKTNAMTWDLWRDQLLHIAQLAICLIK